MAGRPGKAGRAGGEGESLPPPCELEWWEETLLPTSFLGVLFPFILANWSLDWFEQETM